MVPIHQETKLKKNKLFVFLLWGKQRLVSSHKDKDFASMNGKQNQETKKLIENTINSIFNDFNEKVINVNNGLPVYFVTKCEQKKA